MGWDRTFFANLYTNVQLFVDEAPDSGFVNHYGATFAVSNRALDDAATYLWVGVRGQVGKGDQVAAEVYFEYTFGDHLKSAIKFLLFDADPGSGLITILKTTI